jgi:predicted dehydrogenase
MHRAKIYNIGILGFGFIGKVHAYAYDTLRYYYDPPPLTARFTHVVTGHRGSAENARQTLAADVAGTDYRLVTEDPRVDIVHICTPNHLHVDALVSAIAHGKHIYCDKPLTATAAEADRVEAALANYRGTAQMTLQYRFFPATMRMKQLVEQGALGDVLGFRCIYLHGGNANPAAPLKWKLSAAAGGGVIADLAVHAIDLVEHIVGPIARVSADSHIAFSHRPASDDPANRVPVDAEDSVMLLARLRGGAPGLIEATKIATGSEDELRLEVHGTRGALRYNGMDPHHVEFYDATAAEGPLGGLRGWNRIDAGQRYAPPATTFPSLKSPVGWLRGHVACLANFLQCVAQESPAEPGLRHGIRLQRLLDAVRRSAAQGCWIDV